MNNTDIKEIVRRAAKGEQSAFAELYAISYNRVYFYAYRMLQNEEDAIDIVQEVFITVFTSIGELKKPESYMCWLSRITVNLCRDFHKKRTRLVIDNENSDLIERIADEECSVENTIIEENVKEYIIKVIDTLPGEQKRTVLLYYYEQLTVSQIAEIEEVSVSAIKNRLSYARKKIKKAIAFEENRSGTKLFAFGVPALAVVLSQCASAYSMPLAAAREVFMAAMAVANLNYTKKGFDFAGFDEEYKGKGLGGILRNKALFQIRPVYIALITAVIIVAVAGLVISNLVAAHKVDETADYACTEIPVEIVQKRAAGDKVTIRTADIPKQIMQNAEYCCFSASGGEARTVTPERAFLRTVYKERMSLEAEALEFPFYQKTMLIVSFYDNTDKMTGYTYVNYGTSINWPDKIDFVYDFDMDQEAVLSEAESLVDNMMAEADVINESDVWCSIDKNDGRAQLVLKNPETADGTEYLCCIWTGSSENHKEMMREELVSNVIDDVKIKGSSIFDSNIGSLIDDVQDDRYCLVAFIGEGRVTHIGYLDCSKVKEIN